MAAVQKTEIVADIVREDGLQLGTEDVPMPRGRDILILDQNRGRDVAEDEMAVAVAPVQMPRTNLGVHDEHALRMAGADIIGGGRSEEHTSELQSLMRISYAVFCLKKKTTMKYTRPLSSY